MREYYKVACAVNLLMIKNNKVLLGRRQNTGYADGAYSVAGGHIEGNEFPRDAMAREAKEELDITIDPKKLKLINIMYMIEDDHERIQLLYKIDEWEGEPYNAEPEKCVDLQWFDLNSLPSLGDYADRAMYCYINNLTYYEHDARKK